MKTFILVVIMKVYGGQAIQFQEFNSLSQCNYTRELIYVDTIKVLTPTDNLYKITTS